MCKNCGCDGASENLHAHLQEHMHEVHPHAHAAQTHAHVHPHNHPSHTRRIEVERRVLEDNDIIARRNRAWLDTNHITALNLMSSPGAGKTTLLEKTLEHFKDRREIAVITGDQYTDRDQKRLQHFCSRVHQINTQSACHLDASQIERCLGTFVKDSDDLLIIENIGNLVCPAAFDLGEHQKIALLSVTEGEDKPAKYPALFHEADAIVITKIDLIPHLRWNRDACVSFTRKLNPTAPLFWVSAWTGEGMPEWFAFLERFKKS